MLKYGGFFPAGMLSRPREQARLGGSAERKSGLVFFNPNWRETQQWLM